MRSTTIFESKFPKFLIGDSYVPDRVFVIHLHWPRFVGEVIEHYGIGAKIEPTFIDDPNAMPASEMATLMRAAGDFYLEQIQL